MERYVQVNRLYRRRDLTEAETENTPEVLRSWYFVLPHLLDLGDVLYVERCLITDTDCAMFYYKSTNEGILVSMKYKDTCKLFMDYKNGEQNSIFKTKSN